jgi:hypothetical protein
MLSTTFISSNYHIHIYRLAIIRAITRIIMYTHMIEQHIIAQSPCFLLFPFPIPFASLSLPFTYLEPSLL